MQPIRTAADALERTWQFPAVFELRKNTDDWADETAAEDAHDGRIHHGLDMDYDALRRFKQHFDIPDDKYGLLRTVLASVLARHDPQFAVAAAPSGKKSRTSISSTQRMRRLSRTSSVSFARRIQIASVWSSAAFSALAVC
jgi:hypothetical protein